MLPILKQLTGYPYWSLKFKFHHKLPPLARASTPQIGSNKEDGGGAGRRKIREDLSSDANLSKLSTSRGKFYHAISLFAVFSQCLAI